MVVFLIRAFIFIVSAALGLWITSLVVDDFHVQGEGFLVWRKQSHAHSIKGVAATEYRQHEGTNNSKPLHGG